MIQNILTFCVKNDLTFVDGSVPSGKLVANDINRNSIYLITPYFEATVFANFQSNLQADKPTSVIGVLVNGKIDISEVVDPSKSYYDLVKNWNIYEFKVPSYTLAFISRNRTGKIGINFSIEQRLVPMIKPSYGEYQGEILSLSDPLPESGYYINKTIGFELDTGNTINYDLNDILVLTKQEPPLEDLQVKINAYTNRGSTPTALYSVDPSILNDNYEAIQPSLTVQISQQVNENSSNINLLFTNIGTNNATLISLENRISQAEQDIDTAESNITNLQGRMNIAESDIDKIENGTTIVEKALRDSAGNIIKNHYVTFVKPTYNDNNNSLSLEPYNGDDSPMPTRIDVVILPKATTLKDGLMAKEDKVKVDNVASDISSAITNHDNSATAHLPLRTLINDLQKEVDRINAKGRSWGEVDKTFSELWAMAEPTRSEYITDFLLIKFPDFVATDGDLVYTIVSDTEEEHELEFNSALSQWVDNGAYIVGKASNTQMGIVKGDLTYVSILNGLIQVLKSDYATNIGSSGASYDYDDLLALFTEVANDIYKKNETYSATQIEQRITDLLGLANLQDTAIEKSAGVFTFDNGDSLLASSLSQYNWVITRFYNVDGGVQNVRYNLFKPSEATSGNRTIVQIDRSPVRYAEIKRDNGNILFRVVDESDDFDSGYVCTMKMWGVKLDGINATDITYDGGTVEEALDRLLVPAYITATHEALQTEITATNTFEINDETGDVIKITGNEPTNLVVNGDFENTSSWTPFGATLSTANNNGLVINNGTATNGSIYQDILPLGDTLYIYSKARVTNSNATYLRVRSSNQSIMSYKQNPSINEWYFLSAIGVSTNARFEIKHEYLDNATANGKQMEVDYIGVYNVSTMKLKGIKNDDGVLFANLTNGEIKSQLDIWVENGFPTVVEKLVSKSDNLFNAEFNTLSSLDSENLVVNGDLILDSNSDNIPDGFLLQGTLDSHSLTNGVFTATAANGTRGIKYSHTFEEGTPYYIYAKVKTTSRDVGLRTVLSTAIYHSGSGSWEILSGVVSSASSDLYVVAITALGDVTEFSVDYMGAINISDLVNRGILPSGLTNNEYKEMIDKAMFTNVPLRETNYIAVEPNKAYKLIKVSANEVTHKVIEYTTDNQVVKVTPVVYTTNKFAFTTHALTSKIKLVSDLMDRPNVEVTNRFFTSTSNWIAYRGTGSVANGVYTLVGNQTNLNCSIYQDTSTTIGNLYYISGEFMTPDSDITRIILRFDGSGNYEQLSPIANTWYKKTHLQTAVSTLGRFEFLLYHATSISGKTINARNPIRYNITDFINKGVADDNGTLFSRLTNDEIKDQMDIWTEVGFPDHVIAALYPNGVDTAIALKYNDADDVFRPQQIDELPLNLTLRSGEYWQDGYVVKQNGNAEYYPLDTKFSAWNYGQLEAVYTSGLPADFDIQYAQNTAAQVKTTQEFLVEAREQLDYVTDGYDNLVEKLGDAIFSDKYDSYAGITSDIYEYYTLEGIKEGNTLAIEGAGQSIQNLLGKSGTVNATTTTRGVTVTYDSVTGVFTANGTSTAGAAFNITLATGMDFGLPVGTPMQLLRYYDADDGGTVNLNGSYIGYVLLGTTASNRINENSEALYDPYINGSGNLTANHATNKQQLLLQVWSPGIVFTNFKFKVGIYQGLQLRPFILPSGETAKSNVTVYNRTANKLNMPTALNIEDSGLVLTYDPLVQEFLLSGTATATKDISLSATFSVLSGDRFSIKRLYQSGDVTAAGGTLPRLKLVNSGGTAIVYNDIYKMTAPEGETPTPDVTFNTGTAPADATLTLKLGITNGQVFDNYRFRLMIHDKSTDIGYVAYRRDTLGNLSVGANERAVIEFKAIPYGILEFVAGSGSLNLLYADGITDLNKTYLEYNAGIISPNRKISELTARAEIIDNPFRNKVIAVWGDSRESNNPTSDPSGVGDQKDTSWPALLAKKLSATVLNYGLSGGAWAENTVQQDAASAIVNRVQTEDVSASADVIIISSMNDFKLASVLGSPLPDNKDKTTFYGAMRLTYDRLATKYPGKKIVLVLPQKRYDETVNYGGGSYYHYLKAQVEVAKEYGISIVDLYHNFPNAKPAFYATNMLNDTHFSAVGNDKVAELVARELIGNGNKGDMDLIPPIPMTDGSYTLKVTITGGIPAFSWVVD